MAEPCPSCGAERPAHAPRGLCPRCLLQAGLNSEALTLTGGQVGATVELSGPASVLETLTVTLGPVPRVLLADTDAVTGPGPVVKPSSPEMPAPAARPARLQLLGEIAHGGMGAILKGRDVDLGRDLAVKVLLESHKDNPDLVHRFVEEAQIAGQLQHPGVVPVYELGTFADRRPYFSMKLVKGQTLAALLAARPDPAHDLPRFLSIFEAVCQTVAYAHARGVIHRDIKPSNIMVGGFGEVQVMDWGLAKVLKTGGVEDEAETPAPVPQVSVIQTARSGSDADASRAGSVLGTPAYMSPEQARGEIDAVDRRSDVFGLGSILCEILTGAPAFTGRGAAEVQRKATRGDLADACARLDACGADAELIALAKDCLAPERDDRPRDAGAVAARINTYQAGVQERLRQSELDRARAESRALEERKRRRLQMGLAASVLALSVVGGLSFTYWLHQRQARMARADRILGEATTLRDQARARAEDPARWQAALAALNQVDTADLPRESQARLATLRREIEAGSAAARADQELLARLVDIRSAEADDRGGSATDAAYGEAFRAAGLDVDALGSEAAGAKIRARPAPVALALAAALDDWAAQRRKARPKDQDARQRLIAAARAADPDPRRDELRQLWEAPDPKAQRAALHALAEKADVATWPVPTLNLLAATLESAGDFDAAASLLRRVVRGHPDDVWSNYNLAHLLENRLQPPRREEAIRYYTAARALRPESAHELAHALERLGEHDEAVAVFRDLIRLRPENGRHLTCLGTLLKSRGRLDEARAVMDAAESVLRAAIRRNPDDHFARNNLGLVLIVLNRNDQAVVELREAIRHRPDFAIAHANLGDALLSQEKPEEAADAYREALRLQPDLAQAHANLGSALGKQGKPREAADAYREAIRLQPDNANALVGLGAALTALGQPDEADSLLREALRIHPDHPEAHCAIGAILWTQGKLDESAAEFREALRLDPDHVEALSKLGIVFATQGKFDEAIATCREAVRLKPDVADLHGNLGVILRAQGKLDEAAAEFREAIRLRPGLAAAYRDLSLVLELQGKVDEAIAELREAIRLNPDDAESHISLGAILCDVKHDFPAAEAAFRETIRLKPDSATAHRNLGNALRPQGRHDEAVAAYREAIRLNPDDAEAHHDLAVGLVACGKLDEAIGAFREAIRLKPDFVLAHRNLGAILYDVKHDFPAAEAAFRAAVRLKPDYADAHFGLGNTLRDSGDLDGAIAAYRDAIRLQPDIAEAHCNLGLILRSRGEFAEALAELRTGHELGSRQPDWSYPSAEWVRRAESQAALAKRLPAVLRGEAQPADNAERIAFAEMSHYRRNFATAARLWAETLEADAKLADDRRAQLRYNAACAAALAAAGMGVDDPAPDEAAKARLRAQALAWLQAERAAWSTALESADDGQRGTIARTLKHWQADPDLAGVREPNALAKLPEDERAAWQRLWAEVEVLLKKAPVDR